VAGISVPGIGAIVVASSTVMYIGGDTTSSGGGLYKYTASAGLVSATWSSYTFGTGTVSLNPTSATSGVHGLTGRAEGSTFALYITTSTSPNALYRYDTAQDAATTVGAGFTLLASAPSGSAFHAVLPVPITPPPAPPPWMAGDVLVLRVNDALQSASSSQGVWLDEVDPATGIVSVVGPLVGTTPGSRNIALSQQYPWDGWMQLSPDGGVLTFLALDVPVGSQWPGTSYTTSKVAVAVYPNGTVDATAASQGMIAGPDFALNTAIATSANPSGFYVSGPSYAECDTYAGVRYVPAGTSGSNVQVRGNDEGEAK
jgi:hypothetical protein